MHGETAVWVPQAIFGGDPFWISLAIFALTYIAIITERLNRSIIALIGACLMIFAGVLNQQAALRGVDFNTLGLLTGMMVIVAVTRKCGVFQYVAIWSAKKVRASPWGILVMLSLMTAVFSALLDNVTTVLLVAPVTLLITEELKIKPYPFLFAEIFASNIGGTATLIGDPPNIMIGSATGLTFNQFLLNLAPITPLILGMTMVVIYFIWGRGMQAEPAARERVMRFAEREAITDVRLLKQSMFVLSLFESDTEYNTEYKRIKRRHQEGIKKRTRQSKNRPAVAANGLALAHRVHMRSMAPETPKEPSGPISGEPPMIVVLDINLFPVPLLVMYS